VLAGNHQPLRVWILCLYLMGLNLSNRQIAQELDLGESDVQAMAEHLRQGLVERQPEAQLDGAVKVDVQKWRRPANPFRLLAFRMVGATGIEPVTPTMST
jgi:hypothetical protein